MDDWQVERYLRRIGLDRPVRPDSEALRALQVSHLRAVPFENLSIHLGEEIVLTEPALFEKIVERRRGGFCYELNGLFACLLETLGFRVTRLAARGYGEDGSIGPPFDHLALRVDLDEPFLADVGFGRFCHHPLRLESVAEQADPAGVARIEPQPDGDLVIVLDGQPQYRLEQRPRTLDDFTATCWWHQTSPRSHFTQSLVCTRLTENGRVTLSDRRLIEIDGHLRRERQVGDDAEVLATYERMLGIHLDRVPHLVSRR